MAIDISGLNQISSIPGLLFYPRFTLHLQVEVILGKLRLYLGTTLFPKQRTPATIKGWRANIGRDLFEINA
jgi:hypothetical protein